MFDRICESLLFCRSVSLCFFPWQLDGNSEEYVWFKMVIQNKTLLHTDACRYLLNGDVSFICVEVNCKFHWNYSLETHRSQDWSLSLCIDGIYTIQLKWSLKSLLQCCFRLITIHWITLKLAYQNKPSLLIKTAQISLHAKKKKVIYWHLWLHEARLTSMERFQGTKGSFYTL